VRLSLSGSVAGKEKESVTVLKSKKSLSVKKEVSDINACVERCVEILISLCFSLLTSKPDKSKSNQNFFRRVY
jgi:hypothetical protein